MTWTALAIVRPRPEDGSRTRVPAETLDRGHRRVDAQTLLRHCERRAVRILLHQEPARPLTGATNPVKSGVPPLAAEASKCRPFPPNAQQTRCLLRPGKPAGVDEVAGMLQSVRSAAAAQDQLP